MSFGSRNLANRIRLRIISGASSTPSRGSHLGGALSCVDILAAIATTFTLTTEPRSSDESIIVLSKGHACLALYSLLLEIGLMDTDTFNSFQINGSKLGGHPTRDLSQGISISSGSLGLGISHAVGQALYLKHKYPGKAPFVCCVIGDGESSEGIVHESLNLASFHRLDNLFIFLDNNQYQQTGPVSMISNAVNWEGYCNSLNLAYKKASDGHDFDQLCSLIQESKLNHNSCKPQFFNCMTTKGFGCDTIAGNNSGHYTSLTSKQVNEFFSNLSA